MAKKDTRQRLKILITASECVPFAKTGGLADVVGALPKYLRKLGHDVRVALPRYRTVDDTRFGLDDTGKEVTVNIALHDHIGKIKQTIMPGTDIPVYFIDNPTFFDREELYRTSHGEYWDNAERFIFFSRAVVEMLKVVDFQPDIINCNDWHTALIPVYLKTIYAEDEFYKNIGTAFSIHNIAYQGQFDPSKISHAGLPASLFNIDEMEFYGGANFMKGGIVFADAVNTVSETYKNEIQTPEYSFGLDGILRHINGRLHGIINGLDYSVWDPATDKYLPFNFDQSALENKEEIKKEMLKECGLKFYENVPVIGLISRFDDQKGLDFIAAIIDDIMRMNIQLIVLGTGNDHYHDMFHYIKSKYPDKISVNIKFDNRLAHMIYAGSDIFLMPSRFEPCGLGQLIALKYGTVPVGRETGGIADTVKRFNFKERIGCGFLFSGYNPRELFQAIRVSIDSFKNKTTWKKIQSNGMKADFSWEISAKKYSEMFYKILEDRKPKSE